jgi:hypothetical protein
MHPLPGCPGLPSASRPQYLALAARRRSISLPVQPLGNWLPFSEMAAFIPRHESELRRNEEAQRLG